jgi:hypothetical protein
MLNEPGLQQVVPRAHPPGHPGVRNTHRGEPLLFTQVAVAVGQHCFPQCFSPAPQGAAKATPGMEASAPPRRAAPINLSALPRERVPLASPLASSSKELSLGSLAIGVPLSPKGRD